jgi:hypothetical protein
VQKKLSAEKWRKYLHSASSAEGVKASAAAEARRREEICRRNAELEGG